MERSPLTEEEIVELDAALIAAYRAHQRLRKRLPAARHIQFPPIPVVLSESLVAAGIRHLLGVGWSAAYGGAVSDLVAWKTGSRRLRVEVKATGPRRFQELKPKDLRADRLVWLHFGSRYVDGAGAVEAHCLRRPGRFIPTARRLDLSRFLAITSGASSRAAWLVTFNDVTDVFAPARHPRV